MMSTWSFCLLIPRYYLPLPWQNVIWLTVTSLFKRGTGNDVFMSKILEQSYWKMLGIISSVIYIQDFDTKSECFYPHEEVKCCSCSFLSGILLLPTTCIIKAFPNCAWIISSQQVKWGVWKPRTLNSPSWLFAVVEGGF